MQRRVVILAVVAAAIVASAFYLRFEHGPPHFTGFVEGEERIVRSEVAARILETKCPEGERLEPGAVIAVLDDRDIQGKIETKRRELAVLENEIRSQEDRVGMVDSTSKRDVSAQRADLRQAAATFEWAQKSYEREQALAATGASTAQQLDDARSRRDQARSALDRAREMLARAEAQGTNSTLAQNDLETLRKRRDLANAQLAELEVQHSKYTIRAPEVPTVVQAQLAWAGELAQPGTGIVSVIDPVDKYVQIYVAVSDVGQIRIGQKVWIELDSRPGERVPGEVSFIADRASFTPEKIETRNDRVGQVYRVKVRILEGVERLQPGTEGNVTLG